jgi:phosphatidylinositol alpha-mannosyltransferase
MPLIANGVDLRRYAHDVGADEPPSGPLTIVFVGRHEERKGLVVLLEAFERLRKDAASQQVRHARLNVVGDGPATVQLKERFGSDDAISWLGAVDDAEKARELASADVFVAPSLRGESFGVVLLEAMAAGTAVIASDLPGYRLAAGDAARFVPPGDAPTLATALEAVLEDAHERARLRGLATERVRGFSLDAIAEQYMELYEALIGVA